MINKNNNILPFFRKDTSSTLLVLSAAIALVLSSLLQLSNPLLQPAQASTIVPTSMQTRNPVNLGTSCSDANATLTFEAKGNNVTLTSGTFQITDSSTGQTLWSGDLFRANTQEDIILLDYVVVSKNGPVCGIGSGKALEIQSGCASTIIALTTDGGDIRHFPAVVDCEVPSDTTTPQPTSSSSSSMTGTTTSQDSDGDGKPDSSDKCPHNSEHRCFKDEGDTSKTNTTNSTSTTPEQQPSSSSSSFSSSSGNQTG